MNVNMCRGCVEYFDREKMGEALDTDPCNLPVLMVLAGLHDYGTGMPQFGWGSGVKLVKGQQQPMTMQEVRPTSHRHATMQTAVL